jgi:hypothetical protein
MAQNLLKVNTLPEPLSAPPPSKKAEPTVQEAIAHLLDLKKRALAYEGKDGYNPHLWMQNRNVTSLLSILHRPSPSQEDIKEALEITFEEPTITLFEHEYEPVIPKRPKAKHE